MPEVQAMQCLVLSIDAKSQTIGDRVKINYDKYVQTTQKFAPDLTSNSRPLASLCISGLVQSVPNLQSNKVFTPDHTLVFHEQELSDLVALNMIIPKITDEFYGLIRK